MNEEIYSAAFETHRPRLVNVATRVLGSRADAEDAVQEAWLRLDRHAGERIDNLGGWLTRVVGRICIDVLRSRSARAASPLDDWDDGLIVTADEDGPEDAALTADSVALAMVVVLDALEPQERLAFVLHDVFAVPFAQIGPIVDRTADAAKMLASRARRKVREGPRPTGEHHRRREVVDAFLAAAREGDFETLLHLLDPDVTLRHHSPHGDTVKLGAEEVLATLRQGRVDRVDARRVNVNGETGVLVWGPKGRPLALMSCTVANGRLVDIVVILDPARLARLDLPGRGPSW